jgi:asparagine synthase (glutamine-hydrolysing)
MTQACVLGLVNQAVNMSPRVSPTKRFGRELAIFIDHFCRKLHPKFPTGLPDMCGVVGSLGIPEASSLLSTTSLLMMDALQHRGPDSHGLWLDSERGIALGHRRLAVVDLTPSGSQPMLSSDDRYVLSYNGELYNSEQLRKRLVGSGTRFRGRSDTEVMLASIVEWGIDEALRLFDGMFAFALWDRRERQLTLARDRFGEKPMYFGRATSDRTTLLFGSELGSLRKHPRFSGTISPGAVSVFARHGYIPAPYSVFEEVRKVRPGTRCIFNSAGVLIDEQAYWSALDAAQSAIAKRNKKDSETAAHSEEFDEVFSRVVRSRLVADVEVGAFLSGGVDSSLVVAAAMRSGAQIKTFTIGSPDSRYDESKYAREIAEVLGTRHTELVVDDTDARAVVPQLASMYGEPFADSSQIPTFLVSRLARSEVTVAITGDGADELFGGYHRYSFLQRFDSVDRYTPRPLRKALGAGISRLGRSGLALAPNSLVQSVVPGNVADKLAKLGSLLEQDSSDAAYKKLVSLWSNPSDAVPNVLELSTVVSSFPAGLPLLAAERAMLIDTLSYLPDDILVKVDRASMAVSLETRAPFLSPELFDLAWRLPPAGRVDGFQRKTLLRHVLRKSVPDRLVDRPKVGFGVPLGTWLRGGLRDWAGDLLSEENRRKTGLFTGSEVDRLWNEHCLGEGDYSYKLWNVLMFEAWHQSL